MSFGFSVGDFIAVIELANRSEKPFNRPSGYLQDEIKDKISNAVDGMFLLAKLYLDALKGKKSPKAIRNALAELKTGFQSYDETYDKAYEDAMERIEGQISDEKLLAMQLIYWIACAKTPLTTSQLELALAIERESTEFDEDNICPVEDMVSRTQSKWFPQIETDMAAICCTYLSFDEFGSGLWLKKEELQQRLQEHVLYDYASHNWGLHAREASILTPEVTTFLEKDAQVEAASQAQLRGFNLRIAVVGFLQPHEMTGLHLAAYLGLEDAVQFLIGRQNPDVKDSHGRTPLTYAAENRHEAVVKLLLATYGVDPSSKAQLDVTPLYFAVKHGHEAITILSWAAERGHFPIVKLLLDIDGVDPNSNGGRLRENVLSYAVKCENIPIIKLLLARCAQDGLNPDYGCDYDGYTPLHVASVRGKEEIVKLLLAQEGVDVNTNVWGGQHTPLINAIEEGHKVANRLLEHEGKDRGIGRGHEAVVKLLLEHKDIDPDFQLYPRNLTALQYAIKHGQEGIVRLLLAHKGVNPDKYGFGGASGGAGDDSRSPLNLATEKGHMGIVQLLLAHKDINKSWME
ncbi:hypothetical protein O988_09060 [Pseudogymnoascus sp. VKM F-3808]|nr:hypothetical protein O988_09060 [Pseudogymnoascus sp. VKM F-3808]